MKSFRRRIYPSFSVFWREFKSLLSDRKKIRRLMREDQISPSFRERLMLAVTSVNKCRYCAYGHSHRALMEGVTPEEVRELCMGTFERSPEEELPALLYAQHWAENSGNVSSGAREKIFSTYGLQKADAIEMAIRLIHMGNLLGNTFDYLLYRMTLGRIGMMERERQSDMALDGVPSYYDLE